MIYILRQRNGRKSYLKIGHSVNVRKRIRSHQTSSPMPLDLLSLRSGMKKEETDLHHALHEFRVKGEWFMDCPEVMKALDIWDTTRFFKRKHYPMQRLEGYFCANRYSAHDFEVLRDSLDYHPDHWPAGKCMGFSFRIAELAMDEIPDRRYGGAPYEGKKTIIYASNYFEEEAKHYAKSVASILS